MQNIDTKKVVILSQNTLLIDSIQDNFVFYMKQMPDNLSIDYITDLLEIASTRLDTYDKIDLLIIDFVPKNFKDWHKINMVVNLDSNNKIISNEINLHKPLRLDGLFNLIKKVITSEDIFCNIIDDSGDNFIYNERARIVASNKVTINLTEKENKLFKFILLSKDFNAERELILKQVWNYRENTQSSTVETHLYKLKTKLPKNMLKIK